MSATTPIAAQDEAELLAALPRELLIGGAWRGGRHGTFAVHDPATGAALCEVADADAADGADALAAAADAFASFRALAPRERAELLRRAYELTRERREQLALTIVLEMGKPLAEARSEVDYAASYLRWYAEEAVRIGGRTASEENGGHRIVTLEQPVGPCLFVTPWNFPLAMGARKLAPALAAGCTAVVKPAEQTPLSTLALARIFEDAGAPAGVVNVVPTSDPAALVAPLMRDPRLRKLSFTGSTEVGRTLIAQSAEQVVRVSMELGGNAPFLVFEDADLDRAVEGALLAKMRNGGEACTSANRFLVHEAVAERFTERLAQRMAALRVARGTVPGAEVGPLIDEPALVKVERLVADALGRGARRLAGGERIDGPGGFFAPTVLADVPDGAQLLREEIFGPVAPIRSFTDEDAAIAEANATSYGLVAYAFTQDVTRALRVADALESGMIALNQGMVSTAGAPFGGVKQSGLGREGGPEGIAAFLETKYVALNRGG